ncbi:GSCOCG00002659001-RA-CDS [Cotesia congregata]|nr:GSCOCG00002659001-RA-CDS [Cotesia congregata]
MKLGLIQIFFSQRFSILNYIIRLNNVSLTIKIFLFFFLFLKMQVH